ncbi:signal peptidase I [Haladaptatus sp. NG-WS-4]
MSDSTPSVRRAVRIGVLAVLVAGVALMAIVVFPQLVGADQSYVVVSGSMSPTMKAGDVVVRDISVQSIEASDIITFETTDSRPSRTTHRVVEVVEREDGLQFRTKGDANEEPDPRLVPAKRVVGQVWFHIPYLGYLMRFAQSKLGILAFVVVPSVLLVVTEVYSHAKAATSDSNHDGVETDRALDEFESEQVEGTRR